MGKTLETKKKILSLLKNKEMTITELSRELNLSTATISQHLDELQKVGAIEKLENEHFKKLKYYKAVEAINIKIVKYVIGALVVVALLGALFFFSRSNFNAYPLRNTSVNQTGANTTTNPQIGGVGGGGVGQSCVYLGYLLNGTIQSYSGFSLYYLNSSFGKVPDYVIKSGSHGTLYASETVTSQQNGNSGVNFNRQHYAVLTRVGTVFNSTAPGINVTISPLNYSARKNQTITLNVSIATNQAAANQTYWLRIDGPCGGGVTPVLVTVGNGPYTGKVTRSVTPYQ